MSALQFKRFTNAKLLRQIDFELLLQFLSPFQEYLRSKHGFRWTDNFLMFPYQDLMRILADPDDDIPEALLTGLFFVDELSTPKGIDALIGRLKRENRFPNNNLSQVDLVLHAWLVHPEIIESLHAEQHMLRAKRYETCYCRHSAWPDLSTEAIVALEDSLNDWFDSLRKGRGVQVMVYRRNGTIWFHLRHGELLKADNALENSGMTKRIVYRPERYDCIGYTPDDCELRIHSETKREKTAYCRLLGKHLFQDENFFAVGENTTRYTLAPLQEKGREALTCSDVEGMERVFLTELQATFAGKRQYREIYKSENCLFDIWDRIESKFPEQPTFIRASFQLCFSGSSRPRNLTVCTPDVTIFDRDQANEPIGNWLKKRGFVVK